MLGQTRPCLRGCNAEILQPAVTIICAPFHTVKVLELRKEKGKNYNTRVLVSQAKSAPTLLASNC